MMIAMVLLTMCLPAMAAEENDDKLNIKLEQNAKNPFELEGVQLAIYLIAKGEYGQWTMEEPYADLHVAAGNNGIILTAPTKFEARIKEQEIPYMQLAVTDKEGKVQLSGLEHGVYYVQLHEGPENLVMDPMLLAVPNQNEEVKASTDPEAKTTQPQTNEPQASEPQTNGPAVPGKDGELSITIERKGKNRFTVEGIQLVIYKVASGEYGKWTMLNDFSDIDLFTGNDGTVRTSMEEIKNRIKKWKINYTALAMTDQTGKASFNNLEHGIYLVLLRKGPKNLELSPMLVSIPNKAGALQISAKAKHTYDDKPKGSKIPQILVPTKPGEHLVDIDEYETALGLGNIQIHVGVCFE